MKPETQVNIYWHSLLQKWVGEVVELSDQEHCIFHREDADWDLVMVEVSDFLRKQTEYAEESIHA